MIEVNNKICQLKVSIFNIRWQHTYTGHWDQSENTEVLMSIIMDLLQHKLFHVSFLLVSLPNVFTFTRTLVRFPAWTNRLFGF